MGYPQEFFEDSPIIIHEHPTVFAVKTEKGVEIYTAEGGLFRIKPRTFGKKSVKERNLLIRWDLVSNACQFVSLSPLAPTWSG